MRPSARLLLATALLLALGFLAGAVGSRHNRKPSEDPRRSTLLTGPYGARAYAEVLEAQGVRVERYRSRTAKLVDLPPDSLEVLVLLDPARPLDGAQAEHLLEYFEGQGDLLLAGWTTAAAMRCFGYDVDHRGDDSTAVFRPEEVATGEAVSWTGNLVLAAITDSLVVDSLDLTAGLAHECAVQAASRVDTLLVTSGGRPVALALEYEESGRVTLVADGGLFSNGRMRASDAGLTTVPMITGWYDLALFDEYEHGFGGEGSLLAAVLAWSRTSPWGWMFWQLAAAGLVALLAGAVRFGPARRVIERRRRSPLEHVRALATALAAAKGSRVAIDLMIRGLRRRLSAGRPPAGAGVEPWLRALERNARSKQSREAVNTLISLTRGAPGSDSVLRAAESVEVVWQDLKPSTQTR